MAKKEKRGKQIVFVCEECKLAYKEKEIAKKCQEWCSEHKSCNLEIIKFAVK